MKNTVYVTVAQVKKFDSIITELLETAKAERMHVDEFRKLYRINFFRCFRLSHYVPRKLVPVFLKYSARFYDKSALGYNGIIEEIKQRVELYSDISGYVEVREFLKHGEGKTDFYNKEEKTAYEKKTGCGDWLRSTEFDTLSEVLSQYRRKRTVLVWDYEYTARPEGMTGKKSVNKNWTEEEKQKAQEKTKIRKDGTPVKNKEYSINLHVQCTYKQFFDYLETYSGGIETFFRESQRSGRAGVFLWDFQTIKNSKRKVEFLQACPYNKARKEEEEEEEE